MKNNKGFSLVELIIVIAIMAVLVGVLAPTYLQYVEKSKKSNDVSTVDSVVNAIEIAAVDPEVVSDLTTPATIKVKIVKGGTIGYANGTATTFGTATSKWEQAVDAAVSDAELKSFTSVAISATRDANGKVTFAYIDADTDATFKDFDTAITKLN